MQAESRVSDLVVVGASAGGIDALVRLTSSLKNDFPAPIVVAQHLDPHRASHLQEILARRCPLPIETVDALVALRPGVLYLVPANRHVEITDHSVRVLRDSRRRGPRPSIDLLFESAAQRFGEHLIAVVLSGTGTDGAAGARAVHEAGGTVVIQNPETAAFSGMPRSLAPATVHITADAERIGPILAELLAGDSSPREPDEDRALRTLLDYLRGRRGVDFGSYRRPTIMRRMQRRMTATGCPTVTQYSAFVQAHPEEEQQLLSSFLIKVTDFFRDQRPFAYLRDKILPPLIESARARGTGLRIWSAGCATGEEAYTLGLLIADLQEGAANRLPVRIFATDLDSSAVAFARRGVYPANALKNVPPALVQRFFVNVDGEYEVDKTVREMMLFGQHDLSQMPPFPRIDLLVCRNVLMYFTSELQRRVLEAFAFALRDGGYLMLGSAETTRPLPELFTVEQASLKLFRRTGAPVAFLPSQFSAATTAIPSATETVRRGRPARAFLPAVTAAQPSRPESTVRLGSFAAGILIVDRHYDIRLINPAARRLLGIHGAAINEDLIHLVGDDLGPGLRAAIDAMFREGQPTQIDEVAISETDGDKERFLTIALVPDYDHPGQGEPAPRVMLTVTDVTHLVLPRQAAAAAAAARAVEVERLNERLQRLEEANERLLSANEELAMNEEVLRASSEEAAAASAEAQTATEELETYAEELQATSEELETLNEELKATVEELTVSNADLDARAQELAVEQSALEESRGELSAVLISLPEPVVVVASGQPILTNAAYDELLQRLGDDVERRLRDASGHPIPPPDSPLARASRGESFIMEVLVAADGETPRRFEVVGRPVRRRQGKSGRGIVLLHDVTDRTLFALGQEFVSLATHELRTPLTAATAYIELLRSMLEDQNAGAQMTHIAQQAFTAVRRLGDRIADLADVQSLQSGKLSLNRQPTELAGLIAQVVEVAQVIAHGQRIVFESPPGPIVVNVDPRRIEQVLTNLLTNAITYAPDTDQIDVRLQRSGDRAEIQVEDYGPGIPATDLPRIFSRFFQVERSTRTAHQGLGLGLYLAREIMNAHGGAIAVDSIEGKGTTFTIAIPLSPPA